MGRPGAFVWRLVRRLGLLVAIVAAVVVHRRFPWIPVAYLVAVVALPVLTRRVWQWRTIHVVPRATATALCVLAFVAVWPVPWMNAELDEPPGSAWPLDGQLVIDGTTVDPPGTWYWLTVGRPPLVAEVVASWFGNDDTTAPTSMRDGRRSQRPTYTEPAAAAVGLRHAGWSIESGVLIEVSQPTIAGLPERAVLSMVNEARVTTRRDWMDAVQSLHDRNTARTSAGARFEFVGPSLPFGRIDVIEVPADDFDAAVGGRWARSVPGSWYRELSVGSSHGMMVALVSYVHGSGQDLAQGRSIAGTGRILGDGRVGSIGGLVAKATAARHVGADVLIFPAQQASDLAGFDAGGMELLPVTTLGEAIAGLQSST